MIEKCVHGKCNNFSFWKIAVQTGPNPEEFDDSCTSYFSKLWIPIVSCGLTKIIHSPMVLKFSPPSQRKLITTRISIMLQVSDMNEQINLVFRRTIATVRDWLKARIKSTKSSSSYTSFSFENFLFVWNNYDYVPWWCVPAKEYIIIVHSPVWALIIK